MRSLSYLERLVAFKDNRQTVEQLLDAGEQLIQDDELLQGLNVSIREARARQAQHLQQYRRQWQPLLDRLEQPLPFRQQQRRMDNLDH
jgi:hypothetical protein